MDTSKVIKELKLHKFGQKGWMRSDLCQCPSCGKSDKFGILFTQKGGVTHCFRCESDLHLFKYLRLIDYQHLIGYNEKSVDIHEKLPDLFDQDRVNDKELSEIQKPLGFYPIYEDTYLSRRKFLDEHYLLFEPGKSSLEPHLSDSYRIFLLYHGEKLVGWLARSIFGKEYHDRMLEEYKSGLSSNIMLRYRNSPNTDFGKIVGGFNDIEPNTTDVVIVEGIFDKTSVDKELDLYSQYKMRCIFTFGNKVTTQQIELLKTTNVKNVILMYDVGTNDQMKSYSLELSKHFNTKVAEVKGAKDPGDMDKQEMEKIFSNLKDPLYFYMSRI